jgi:diguanylate cyclase (GGDEF)-like protein
MGDQSGVPQGIGTNRRNMGARMIAPFNTTVPAPVRDSLTLLQYERLHALTPLMCLTIIAIAIAMATAVMGDLPLWQQVAPPVIIISVCLARLVTWRKMAIMPPAQAWLHLRRTVFVVGGLGLVAGLWSVNAFDETDKYYCMVAPVFLCMAALVSANCLTTVPGAARAAMVMACAPMAVCLISYDNLGVRSMGVILILIVMLQLRLIRTKFIETEKMLILQHEITAMAESDGLTSLKNRRAFTAQLQAQLDSGAGATVAMLDLDGFKAANDTYGHHAGDEVLISVAGRMNAIAVTASCAARLGGDEFALLYGPGISEDQVRAEVAALVEMIALPHPVGNDLVSVSASVGIAHADDGDMATLLQSADRALYADKRKHKAKAGRTAAAA